MIQSVFHKKLNIYFLYFYVPENAIQSCQLAKYLKSVWLCYKWDTSWGTGTYISNVIVNAFPTTSILFSLPFVILFF